MEGVDFIEKSQIENTEMGNFNTVFSCANTCCTQRLGCVTPTQVCILTADINPGGRG